MAPRTGIQRETIEACKHCEHNGASCDTDHNRSHLSPVHPALSNLLAPPVPLAASHRPRCYPARRQPTQPYRWCHEHEGPEQEHTR